MSVVELETKPRKIVKDPRMSLTMIARFVTATEKGKLGIMKNSKYPPKFVPGYYEMARKCACELFESNFIDDQQLYFDEFSRQAVAYRKKANGYPKEKVLYKNYFYSAKGLDGLVAISTLLSPLLQEYTFRSNLSRKKNAITLNSVRIGAMADLLLFDQYGMDHIGFMKFNFSTTKLKESEAAAKLHVLNRYFKENGVDFEPENCILVDVSAWRIYTLANTSNSEHQLDKATRYIRDNWDLVSL